MGVEDEITKSDVVSEGASSVSGEHQDPTSELVWLMRGVETPGQRELYGMVWATVHRMKSQGRQDINEFTIRQELDTLLTEPLSPEDSEWVEKYLHTPIEDREESQEQSEPTKS